MADIKLEDDVLEVDLSVPTTVKPAVNNGYLNSDISLHDDDHYQVTDDRGRLVLNDDATDFYDVVLSRDAYHCHAPRSKVSTRARNQLITVSVLCVVFMIAEILGGLLSNSLALVTDATHLASDVTGFLVSLFAIWIAKKHPTKRLSFGFYRAEVVGALTSVLIIWVITGVLLYLAVERLKHHNDYEISANEMLITAGLGVLFNVIMGLVLHSGFFKKCHVPHGNFGHGHSHGHGHSLGNEHSHGSYDDNTHAIPTDTQNSQSPSSDHMNMQITRDDTNQSNYDISPPRTESDMVAQMDTEVVPHSDMEVLPQPQEEEEDDHKMNINVRAALIHVIGDLIQSVGVFIAAIIIKIKPEYKIADPICTFIFSILVLITTVTVLKDVVFVIMEAVPNDVDYLSMKKDLESLQDVMAVHSLNVWALTIEKNVATVHIAIGPSGNWERTVQLGTKLLREKYHMLQSTIQVERYQEEYMATCHQCIGPKLV